MARHQVLVIDCDTCPAQGSGACQECVVSYVCDHDPDTALVLDLREVRALRLLAAGGLVPELRHPAHSAR